MGVLNSVGVSRVEVIRHIGGDDAAAELDAQVDEGVYALEPDVLMPLKGSGRKLTSVPEAPGGAERPILVLVHGTFVDTATTFGPLWSFHPELVRELFEAYGGRVYALDHATLGRSVAANALTLVQAMPENAHIHLITHSRGGLIAELLANANHDQTTLAAWSHSGRDADEDRMDLETVIRAARGMDIHIDRVVRVACPAGGTMFARQRLDLYLSVFMWTLEIAGLNRSPQLVELAKRVALRREQPSDWRGLSDMLSRSRLMMWLAETRRLNIRLQMRIVAGVAQGNAVFDWLNSVTNDEVAPVPRDLVVARGSTLNGAPAGSMAFIDEGPHVSHFAYFSNADTARAIVDALLLEEPPGFSAVHKKT